MRWGAPSCSPSRSMRMWLLAIAVALLGASALHLAGLVDLSKSIYASANFTWLSHLVGGLLFGVGMDDNVGEVLQALDDAGLADETRVVYTSDHGDNVGARGLWGKSTMYEESAAVPLLMRTG